MPKATAVLLVHGGAGAIPRHTMTAERDAAYRRDLDAALHAGRAVLDGPGGDAIDAVEAAVRVLEDSPLFNAAHGAVFNRDGRNELDASIMDGRDRRAGAVAGLARVRNPIRAARAVLESSGHVFLAGPGAERFAVEQGIELVDPSYFRTEERWESYRAADAAGDAPARDQRFGTVGAVALDRRGHLAAGTSTGGMTYKLAGRVGDTPVVGAGVYAEDGVAAVSCTGDGEAFLRVVAAYELIARIKYSGLSVVDAADRVIFETVAGIDGEGGLIALGPDGSFALPFNADGMYRGVLFDDGTTWSCIYEGSPLA